MTSDAVRIVEVGPRDGLQNEAMALPVATKLEFIARLIANGLPTVEIASFVSPKWVPQMADAEAIVQAVQAPAGVRLPVLVPNVQGYARAKAAGAREVAVFTAASDAFTQRNTNATVTESMVRVADIVAMAKADGIAVRGYVSTVLGCPYQGRIEPIAVVPIAAALWEMGCYEVSLGDTIGVGTAHRAQALVHAVAQAVPISAIAVHFHDTYGQALANVLACLELGVRVVDASTAGLGGCPYAQGASGNLATEDLVYALQGLGLRTGVDLPGLVDTAQWMSGVLDRAPASRVGRVKPDSAWLVGA